MILSAVQIAQYAVQAGFRGAAVAIAVAVALAESSGEPGVTNLSSGAAGLWQVLPSAHPEYSVSALLDPSYNARAAYAISNGGTNWRPWAAYNSGAYLRFMGQAQQAAQAAQAASGAATSPPVIVASTAPNGAVTVAAIGVIAGIAYLAFG